MPQDRFVELVTKELIGDLTSEEEKELQSLLTNLELRDQYNLLNSYLTNNYEDQSSDDQVFKQIYEKIAPIEGLTFSVPKNSQNKRIKAWFWPATIAAILAIVSAFMWTFNKTNESTNQVAVTKRALKRELTLSDGTKVFLNSESKLVYPKEFKGKFREVTLVGEAFFDVTKDPVHPFIIHTRELDVKVLGTAFNVKSYPNDDFTETTLLRGVIQVTLKDRQEDRITLQPSEKLIVKNSNSAGLRTELNTDNDALAQITHFQKNDTSVVETSWIYDRVVFKDKSLEEICKMLERVYDVEMEVENQDLKVSKFTGNFERQSVSDILKSLSLVQPFAFKVDNKKIIIQ